MLAKLRMELDAEDLTYKKSSLFQGVLMERIDSAYGEELHQQKMRPYSQYITREKGKNLWYINTLDEESYEKIICPFLNGPDVLTLCHPQEREVHIRSRELTTKKKATLLQEFYNEQANNKVEMEFQTPTAFRQKGRYIILPDLRLLCQNLMMKYSATSGQVDMVDEETLEQLTDHSILSRHRIRSLPFPMEGTVIPGFVGTITIQCKGTETMARYLRLLLEFGEYSGVGVRTAMGMGAIHIRREED